MEMMFKEELDRDKLMKRLDDFLTLDINRELFELSVLEERKESETTGKSKLAKSRRVCGVARRRATVNYLGASCPQTPWVQPLRDLTFASADAAARSGHGEAA